VSNPLCIQCRISKLSAFHKVTHILVPPFKIPKDKSQVSFGLHITKNILNTVKYFFSYKKLNRKATNVGMYVIDLEKEMPDIFTKNENVVININKTVFFVFFIIEKENENY